MIFGVVFLQYLSKTAPTKKLCMTVYFPSAFYPSLELIPLVITMAICIKADVNCKDNDTIRCSDQTYIENNLLLSDQWYDKNSFLRNARQNITD